MQRMGQVNSLLPLADLALRLGAVNRATLYPDGVTPESDTDHTVMLQLSAVSVAVHHRELGLDAGMVALYALVHDLVEAYAGDVNTFIPDANAAKDKAQREAAALVRIEAECAAWPWIANLIRAYEAQQVSEARFVRYLDKAMPKLTHTLNHCAAIKRMGHTRERLEEVHERQEGLLATEYPEFAPIVGAYLHDACNASEAAFTEDPPAHPHDAAGMDWSAR